MSDKMTMEYQEVKFGEIARQIAKRVDPSETSLDIYVGLEHLDPDSLKIARHGVPSDVKGEKLLVKQGQIIFGKRRAYQRKVAVADWDCICSAHAMVLEAIPGKILPEFLPFFMQSNQFMERAVEISEGSLSPTIKWKILAEQNFSIPNKNEQEIIVNVLKKNNKVENILFDMSETLEILLEKYRNKFFQSNNKMINLNKHVQLKGGSSFKPEYQGNQSGFLPFIKVSDMNHCENQKYILRSENWIDEEDIVSLKPAIFPKGSCVFAKVGAALFLNRRRVLTMNTAIDNNMMAAIPDEMVESEYLYHFLCTLDFKNYVQEGALPSVNQKIIGEIKFPLRSIPEQKKIIKILNLIDKTLEQVRNQQVFYKTLKYSFLNKTESI